jgi:transcriptional regulator with XRE-family HTH domain
MKQSEQKRPMQEVRTWREQLSISIRNSEEKKRIAHQIGVNPLTIARWAKNESYPHKQSLQKLLTILPECQEELTELSDGKVQKKQFAEVDTTSILSLYTQVLNAYSLTPPALLFWSISQHILQHALSQLATRQNAVEIVVAQCTPPSHNGLVRSLQEIMGGNRTDIHSTFERKRTFLGVESLAGAVLASPHKKVVQNFADERYFYPRSLDIGEECSCVVCPILHANRVSGCLLVSSTTPNYFSLQKQRLIEQYAELFALAFDDKQFYPLEAIELYPMPHPNEQYKHILTFRQRVRQAIQDAGLAQPLTVLEAEQLVWQQIEQELIDLAM